MRNGNFRKRLGDEQFREDLGKKLTEAKKNGDLDVRVRYGNGNEMYGKITIGSDPFEDRSNCGQHGVLKRSKVLKKLEEYVQNGHEKFFDDNNLKANQRAYTYYVLYEERLCDLKAVARVLLDLKHGEKVPNSKIVAQAIQNLGLTYVHFRDEGAKESKTIYLMKTREVDGLSYGRAGEGKNHKKLRKWVKNNSKKVIKYLKDVKGLKDVKAKTEVLLLSGDRVDVVYYGRGITVVIEVKSRDSNVYDLLRGIYQCIKYKSVMRAQMRADDVKGHTVCALLVTEDKLPNDLRDLADALKVKCQDIRPS